MLLSLHIENIAIIEKSDIDFSGGFNVLTGETGAGKSIIIDSIGLLTGAKSSKELIGPHADFSFVSAVFAGFTPGFIEALTEFGFKPDEDGNIIISRKITRDGRSVARINSCPVTISALKQIAAQLINIHGQHDGSKILDPASHISYLDEYCKIHPLIDEYRKKYDLVKNLRKRLDTLNEIKSKKEDLESALKFKIEELERADLKPGEYERLKKARLSAQNSALISNALFNAQALLSQSDGCMLDSAAEVVTQLEGIKNVYGEIEKALNLLSEIKVQLEEASALISEHLSDYEESEYTSEYIENRLYVIENAVKKYSTEENALSELERFKNELLKLEDNDSEIESTVSEYKASLAVLESAAGEISLQRTRGAKKLAENICSQLKELDMPQVKFEAAITRSTNQRGGTKYTPNGYDRVEFLISANSGLPLRPISKIASGGELSRIMLCLKSTLNNESTDCPTVIYDEIDSGVSGGTAQKIGYKLKSFAKNKQVFCITHLAQIAALADHHYKIEKLTLNDKTLSRIRLLTEPERRTEIARIMGGANITNQLLKTADELISGIN